MGTDILDMRKPDGGEGVSPAVPVREKGEKATMWRGRKGGQHRPLQSCPLGLSLAPQGIPTPQLTHPVSPSPCKKITWKRIRDGEDRSYHLAIIPHCPPTSGHPSPSPKDFGMGGREVAAKQVINPLPPVSKLLPSPHCHLHFPHTPQPVPQLAWGLPWTGELPYRGRFPLSSRHSGSIGGGR